MKVTYAIAHTGSNNFYATGIKTMLGAKRLAKQGIQQSFNGRLEVYVELHHTGELQDIQREMVSVLHGYNKKWTDK